MRHFDNAINFAEVSLNSGVNLALDIQHGIGVVATALVQKVIDVDPLARDHIRNLL